MPSLPQVASALQHVLTEVPEQHAHATEFCRRRSKLSASAFVQAVVLGWLATPASSLHQLSQRAAGAGVAISPQGLDQRFTPAAVDLLRRVAEAALGQALAAEPVATGLLARFPAVVVLDATTIRLPDALAGEWPGCGGGAADGSPTVGMQAALKLHVRLDLTTGALAVGIGPGKEQDKASALQHAAVPAGGLRIADLGYWSLDVFAEIAAQDAYFLSRLSLTTNVYAATGDATGKSIDVVAWLGQQRRRKLAVAVQLGAEAKLPARLIAVRVPARVAAARRDAIRAEARQEGRHPPSADKLALADWTLLVTNAPPDVLGIADALVLARARWQIELLFKLWKTGGQLDAWRTTNPHRIRGEVHAKLIALVIQHWALLTGCWDRPDRSLTKAAQTVRDHAVTLLLALRVRTRLVAVLKTICDCLAAGCRIASRRAKPSLFQLLADPSCGGLT